MVTLSSSSIVNVFESTIANATVMTEAMGSRDLITAFGLTSRLQERIVHILGNINAMLATAAVGQRPFSNACLSNLAGITDCHTPMSLATKSGTVEGSEVSAPADTPCKSSPKQLRRRKRSRKSSETPKSGNGSTSVPESSPETTSVVNLSSSTLSSPISLRLCLLPGPDWEVAPTQTQLDDLAVRGLGLSSCQLGQGEEANLSIFYPQVLSGVGLTSGIELFMADEGGRLQRLESLRPNHNPTEVVYLRPREPLPLTDPIEPPSPPPPVLSPLYPTEDGGWASGDDMPHDDTVDIKPISLHIAPQPDLTSEHTPSPQPTNEGTASTPNVSKGRMLPDMRPRRWPLRYRFPQDDKTYCSSCQVEFHDYKNFIAHIQQVHVIERAEQPVGELPRVRDEHVIRNAHLNQRTVALTTGETSGQEDASSGEPVGVEMSGIGDTVATSSPAEEGLGVSNQLGLPSDLQLFYHWTVICMLCNRPLTTLSSYRKHLESSHPGCIELSPVFECKKCLSLEEDPSKLELHMANCLACAATQGSGPESGEAYVCMRCDKSFAVRHHLREHIQGVHGPERYRCTTCREGFRWRSTYYRHRDRCPGHTNVSGSQMDTSEADGPVDNVSQHSAEVLDT